jgi:hypothetical protein
MSQMLQIVLRVAIPGLGDISNFPKAEHLFGADVVFHFASHKQPLDSQSLTCVKPGGTWLTLNATPASDAGQSAIPASFFSAQQKPVCVKLFCHIVCSY